MLTLGRLESTCAQPNLSLSVKCGCMSSVSLSGVEFTTCPHRRHMKRHVSGARGRFDGGVGSTIILMSRVATICTRQVVDPTATFLDIYPERTDMP